MPDGRVEIMPPALRHYCQSDHPNTGIWCEPDRDDPIRWLYTYTYTCLVCGYIAKVRVERVLS
jgi:hypothetical protein